MTKHISLRWFEGKQLLAFLRGDDYAHPGEEEAIVQVFSHLPKNKERTILDVGCGLGKTAQFIQSQGWGKVAGADVDAPAIEYAKKKYPDIEFFTADAVALPQVLAEKKFDVICLFNSFYAFPEQLLALTALRQLAHEKTQLIIFEYADLTHGHNPFTILHDARRFFLAIRPEQIGEMMQQAGWRRTKVQIITADYERWYDAFVKRIAARKSEIIVKFGAEKYEMAFTRYSKMLNEIRSGTLGGCIVEAWSMPVAFQNARFHVS